MRHVDPEGLVGYVRTPVPADPRQKVVDPHGHDHDDPFNIAEEAIAALGVNFLAAAYWLRSDLALTAATSCRSTPWAASTSAAGAFVLMIYLLLSGCVFLEAAVVSLFCSTEWICVCDRSHDLCGWNAGSFIAALLGRMPS